MPGRITTWDSGSRFRGLPTPVKGLLRRTSSNRSLCSLCAPAHRGRGLFDSVFGWLAFTPLVYSAVSTRCPLLAACPVFFKKPCRFDYSS